MDKTESMERVIFQTLSALDPEGASADFDSKEVSTAFESKGASAALDSKGASAKCIGRVTLNVERGLNAISLDMVSAIYAQLLLWQQDDDIAMVYIDGAGDKAFCAGGDVRAIYHAAIAAPGEIPPAATAFFGQEYRLDHLLHTYTKPVLVWGDGIVMGGGLGLMMGGSHRVVTERSRIAMPEVTIGLYPDVGGSYFLQRMPGKVGLFLGLTAYNMDASDAKYVGIATHMLDSNDKQALLDALVQLSWDDERAVNHRLLNDALATIATEASWVTEAGKLETHQGTIDALMAGPLSSILVRASEQHSGSWLERPLQTMLAGSPISMQLIYRQSQMSQALTLAEVFRFELGLSLHCCALGDFNEGVRALLIDKDRQPKWQYDKVSLVPDALIAQMWASPWSMADHPLHDLHG